MTAPSDLLLAGDVGATKTTLALYQPAAWPGPPLRQATLRNRDFAGFDDLLSHFLGPKHQPTSIVCLGVAGPVAGDTVHLTNLGWVISAEAIRERCGCGQVRLINDLLATAMGVPHLTPADLFMLNPGETRPGAAMAVLAPGSGLGEAFVIDHDGRRLSCPSEGGHASFAPRNEEQLELLTFMRQRQDHVSVEQVCSGLALPHLFAFLSERMEAPGWLVSKLAQAADRTPVIVQAAIASAQGVRPCTIAEQTLGLFLDILADEAANLALKTLALGGVYLGGGLTARLLPLLDAGRFMAVFARGTYREMLARIPVRVITNPETALLGAAACGIEVLLAAQDARR